MRWYEKREHNFCISSGLITKKRVIDICGYYCYCFAKDFFFFKSFGYLENLTYRARLSRGVSRSHMNSRVLCIVCFLLNMVMVFTRKTRVFLYRLPSGMFFSFTSSFLWYYHVTNLNFLFRRLNRNLLALAFNFESH